MLLSTAIKTTHRATSCLLRFACFAVIWIPSCSTQVALYEFYTGAQTNNFQAYSYAVLEYTQNANLTKTLLVPEWDPDRDFPSAGASLLEL